MQLLRITYIGMLKRVLRLRGDAPCTNGQILRKAGTLDICQLLALDRLRYARKLFCDSPEFLQTLMHVEFQYSKDSWLHGLAEDLRWANTLVPNRLPAVEGSDFTDIIDFWQQPGTPWKRTLRHIKRMASTQEHMMSDLQVLHSQFFTTLRRAGAEFNPDFDTSGESSRSEVHRCPCGRQFDTPQGLALHRVRAHQIYAPEHAMTCGATCPNCMRFCWTSARLQQHLAYIPRGGGVNHCYQALLDKGFRGGYQIAMVARPLRGALRLDSLQAAGPRHEGPTQYACQEAQVRAEILALEEELLLPAVPMDHLAQGQILSDKLSQCTHIWIDKFRGGCSADVPMTDLGDWWMRLLFTFDERFESWTELVFLSWGQHVLPDILANVMDGDIEIAIEEVYYDIYKVLPRTETLDRIAFLKQKLNRIETEAQEAPVPHRPSREGTANPRERRATVQNVPSLFHTHADWLRTIRQVQWKTLPMDVTVPIYRTLAGRQHFLIAHIFSGRRRHGDVHQCIALWAQQRNVDVTILSMDTAISVTYGNLSCQSTSWSQLLRCYEKGWVSATLAGTPCETFTLYRKM